MSRHKKIQVTKNYRLFTRSQSNRPTDVKKHMRLEDSLRLYGFMPEFPIVCIRDKRGNLIVKDGQHRLEIAETLGLEVWYVESDTDFDIALVNSTGRIWTLKDYTEMYIENGLKPYAEAIEFARTHRLSLSTAYALLAGTINFSNCHDDVISGKFEVRERPWAEAVVKLYVPLAEMFKAVRNTRMIEACMAVCRVGGFDCKRVLSGAKQDGGKFVALPTRDQYLEVLEHAYNYKRSRLFALKNEALMALRARNAAVKKGGKEVAAVA